MLEPRQLATSEVELILNRLRSGVLIPGDLPNFLRVFEDLVYECQRLLDRNNRLCDKIDALESKLQVHI